MSRSSTGSWPQHQQVVASVCSHTSSSNSSSSSQSSLILGIFPQKCCWKIFLAGLEPHFGSQKCWWRFFTKKWRQRRRAVCLLFFVCIVLSTYYRATSHMRWGAASPPAVTGSFNYGRLLVLCPLLATSSAKNCTKMQLSSSSSLLVKHQNPEPSAKALENRPKAKGNPQLEVKKNIPTSYYPKSYGFAIENAINLPTITNFFMNLCHQSLFLVDFILSVLTSPWKWLSKFCHFQIRMYVSTHKKVGGKKKMSKRKLSAAAF